MENKPKKTGANCPKNRGLCYDQESENVDEIEYRKSFLDSIGRGIADADGGKTYSTGEIRAALNSY
jgi:hypothetical protein